MFLNCWWSGFFTWLLKAILEEKSFLYCAMTFFRKENTVSEEIENTFINPALVFGFFFFLLFFGIFTLYFCSLKAQTSFQLCCCAALMQASFSAVTKKKDKRTAYRWLLKAAADLFVVMIVSIALFLVPQYYFLHSISGASELPDWSIQLSFPAGELSCQSRSAEPVKWWTNPWIPWCWSCSHTSPAPRALLSPGVPNQAPACVWLGHGTVCFQPVLCALPVSLAWGGPWGSGSCFRDVC